MALLVAAICWYLGTDVWHSVLLGCVLTTVGVAGLVGSGIPEPGDSFRWHLRRPSRDGARGEIAELSWALRGRYGRVTDRAVWRLQRLARQRLALHQLELNDPADRLAIERLIGRRAYAVLVKRRHRPPFLGSLLHCLDMLDALDPSRPTRPSRPGRFARERSGRARAR